MEHLEKRAEKEPFFRRVLGNFFPYNVLAKLSEIVSCSYDRFRRRDEDNESGRNDKNSEEY